MIKLILSIIGISLVFFFINLFNLIRCGLLNMKINKAINNNDIESLIFHRNTFLRLTFGASVHDKTFVKEYETYGSNYVQVTNARTEFPYHGSLNQSQNMLVESAGYFWNKALSSLNPLSWIRVALLLPSYILSYIGLNRSSSFSKLLNVVWWLLCAIWWLFKPQVDLLRETLYDYVISLF